MKLFYCLFLSLTLLFTKGYTAQKYELSVCAIFQNEAPYLKEWIEFHRLAGVQHFYLYNNLSNDDFKKVLKPYIKDKVVELIDWAYNTNPDGSNWPTIEAMAHDDALARAKKTSKWLAIIDVDEFLFPVEKDNLVDFLRDYEDCPAVSVNWQMYGTSHVDQIPKKKLLIETLKLKAPTDFRDNIHVKTIVQTQYATRFTSPHFVELSPGYSQHNTDKVPFTGPYAPYIIINKARINHYWTRDGYYLKNQKIPRRQKWGGDSNVVMQMANQMNQVEDTAIMKYAPALKKKMKK